MIRYMNDKECKAAVGLLVCQDELEYMMKAAQETLKQTNIANEQGKAEC